MKHLLVRVGTIGSVLDMMRYDRCYPTTEEDAGRLSKSVSGRKMEAEDYLVIFTMHTAKPTVHRWKSFGCEVLITGSYAQVASFRDKLVDGYKKMKTT